MVDDQEGGARVIMRRRHPNTRLRSGFLAASATVFALSFVVAAPTMSMAATEPTADETLSLNGSGRYADQLAHVVLEYGTDVDHNPYALLVEFEPDADPADVDELLEQWLTFCNIGQVFAEAVFQVDVEDRARSRIRVPDTEVRFECDDARRQ
ncbi:MAG: hypothetical protein ACPGQJ_11040, partial [Acidimicrobiales bacterium]